MALGIDNVLDAAVIVLVGAEDKVLGVDNALKAATLALVCNRATAAIVNPATNPVPPITAPMFFKVMKSMFPSSQQLVVLPPVEQHQYLLLQR